MLEDADEFAGHAETLAEGELARLRFWLADFSTTDKTRRAEMFRRVANQLKDFAKFYDRYLAILCREVRP